MAPVDPGKLGVLVVGAGTIGTLRAKILRRHPSVGFLGVCDIDEAKARRLAEDCGADAWSAATMWNAKCLVQVEMANIRAKF